MYAVYVTLDRYNEYDRNSEPEKFNPLDHEKLYVIPASNQDNMSAFLDTKFAEAREAKANRVRISGGSYATCREVVVYQITTIADILYAKSHITWKNPVVHIHYMKDTQTGFPINDRKKLRERIHQFGERFFNKPYGSYVSFDLHGNELVISCKLFFGRHYEQIFALSLLLFIIRNEKLIDLLMEESPERIQAAKHSWEIISDTFLKYTEFGTPANPPLNLSLFAFAHSRGVHLPVRANGPANAAYYLPLPVYEQYIMETYLKVFRGDTNMNEIIFVYNNSNYGNSLRNFFRRYLTEVALRNAKKKGEENGK